MPGAGTRPWYHEPLTKNLTKQAFPVVRFAGHAVVRPDPQADHGAEGLTTTSQAPEAAWTAASASPGTPSSSAPPAAVGLS